MSNEQKLIDSASNILFAWAIKFTSNYILSINMDLVMEGCKNNILVGFLFNVFKGGNLNDLEKFFIKHCQDESIKEILHKFEYYLNILYYIIMNQAILKKC